MLYIKLTIITSIKNVRKYKELRIYLIENTFFFLNIFLIVFLFSNN